MGLKKWAVVSIVAANIFFINTTWADDGKISAKDQDTLLGHKKHPEHDYAKLKISGDLTTVMQGVVSNDTGDDRADFSYSGDLFLEFPVHNEKNHFIFMHLEMGQGNGVTDSIAETFASPNADIGFDEDNVKIAEAYYEAVALNDMLTFTFGKLDATAYFDTNKFANNETSQFLSSHFVNNPVIEFPGYGAGARLSYAPSDLFSATFGIFDSEGDFNNIFDRSFFIGEIGITPHLFGREGKYSTLLWQNGARHEKLKNTDETTVNTGFSLGIDQEISDTIGIFARFGMQRENVAIAKMSESFGIELKGSSIGRDEDALGIAYSAIHPGKDYKETTANIGRVEDSVEIYYKCSLYTKFQISPSMQWINDPKGDVTKRDILIYGVRGNFNF